jgi:hypothetical protein
MEHCAVDANAKSKKQNVKRIAAKRFISMAKVLKEKIPYRVDMEF